MSKKEPRRGSFFGEALPHTPVKNPSFEKEGFLTNSEENL